MASKADRISASEFSSLSGIPISKVSRLIREGRIRATKQTGKWMILKSQLKSKAVQELSDQSKKKPAKKMVTKTKKSPAAKKKATLPTQKSGITAKNKKPAIYKKKTAVKMTDSNKKAVPVNQTAETKEKPRVPKKKRPASENGLKSAENSYSMEEFSKMTYLTEFGVTDWLKKGWLIGEKKNNGEWRVSASSLELSRMRRLIR